VILLGYVAGKKLHAQRETLASIAIYILTPVVIFDGVVTTALTPSALSLPVVFFLSCCLMCVIFYLLASLFWKDAHRNILAFTAGSGNTGYFGLPVALALFGPDRLGPIVLSILGFVLYENSVGFFVTARGHHTIDESIGKVLRLPSLYAFAIGVVVNLLGSPLGESYAAMAQNFRGAYSVIGMMLIGLGIAAMPRFSVDLRFISIAFLAKFVAWPLWIAAILLLDQSAFHFYDPSLTQPMLLMAIVPLAANTVALATELRTEPEKAAMTVLLSTLVALVYIPVFVMMFF
jgi:malate permease and related proteins